MNKPKNFDILKKIIVFTDRVINFYLYYVVMACFLSLVPNINPNYPLFKFIFKSAGFYIIPPVYGFSFTPMVILITIVLISVGLNKILELIIKNEPEVIYISAEVFAKGLEKFNQERQKALDNKPEDDNDKSESEDDK